MADPVSVKRQLDELTDQQIRSFKKPAPFGAFDLFEFELREAEMQKLVTQLEQSKPPAPWPVPKRKWLHPSV